MQDGASDVDTLLITYDISKVKSATGTGLVDFSGKVVIKT